MVGLRAPLWGFAFYTVPLRRRCCCAAQITGNIHGEVESQHKVLDRMAASMGGIQMGLGASVDKFKKVRPAAGLRH